MNENNIQIEQQSGIEQQSEAQAKRLLAYYSYLRKSQKMTQSELERITGLSRIAINRCENGKLMPTIRSMNIVLLDPEKTHSTDTQKKNGDIVCSGIIESARAALEAGIKVGLGTDSSCPFVTQYDMWREVAYFAKYVGVSNAFALHTATQVNAELLGLGDETGTIECGKAADILVTRENPLDDLRALREPMHVMCRGDLVRKLKVKRIPEVDTELDAIMAMPAEALAEELARDGVA